MVFNTIIPQPNLTLKRARAFESACLIFNPVSGQGNAQQDLETIKSFLEPHLKLDICETTPEIGADQLAKEALKRGVELIIASGGDGTVSAVANAVIGTDIHLAIIPRGTANAFANGLGLPITLEEACLAILQGASLTVDTARCNGQPMLLLAGIGFEANTVKEADRTLKDQLGIFAYILAGLNQLQNLQSFEARLETDTQSIIVNAAAITVANFAPPTSILAQGIGSSRADDGLLDITIIAPVNALEALSQAMELFEGGLVRSSSENNHIGYLRVHKVNVTTNPPQPITLDGEMLEATSAFFEIVPASLKVISSYKQVVDSQEKLEGLPNLRVIEKLEEEIEDIILYAPIPVNLAEVLAQSSSEVAEACLTLWHTLVKAVKAMSQACMDAINYGLWLITEKLDELFNEGDNLKESADNSNLNSNYTIIHQILGRMRLRIPRLYQDENYGICLENAVKSLNGVESVNIYPLTSSLVVHYTPTLPERDFQELLLGAIAEIT